MTETLHNHINKSAHNMMQLHTFGPALGQIDASPFCLKAMCLLTQSGIDWQPVPDADVRKAPYKKLPVLTDGDQTIPDSDNIRYHLQKTTGIDFDAVLTKQQRAQSRAIIRLTEEHLYFCLVYDRWLVDESWNVLRGQLFSSLPTVLRKLIPPLVRRTVIRDLKGQGIGRLGYSQMLQRATLDLAAIEDTIAGQAFLFGDTPSAADASVAAMLSSITAAPVPSQLSAAVKENTCLTDYVNRAKETIFPRPAKWQN